MSNINNLNVEMSSLQIFILFAVKKNTSQIFFTKKKKKEQVSNKWNVKTFAYSCKITFRLKTYWLILSVPLILLRNLYFSTFHMYSKSLQTKGWHYKLLVSRFYPYGTSWLIKALILIYNHSKIHMIKMIHLLRLLKNLAMHYFKINLSKKPASVFLTCLWNIQPKKVV